MKNLTDKQLEKLKDIFAFMSGYKRYPTFSEMMKRWDYKSNSVVTDVLDALEFKGMITKRSKKGFFITPLGLNIIGGEMGRLIRLWMADFPTTGRSIKR